MPLEKAAGCCRVGWAPSRGRVPGLVSDLVIRHLKLVKCLSSAAAELARAGSQVFGSLPPAEQLLLLDWQWITAAAGQDGMQL